MKIKKSVSTTVLTTVLLALGGCGTLSPYVESEKSPYRDVKTDLDRSINYTIGQARAWRTKANSVSNSQTSLYALALPTSAVAAYFAITGDRGTSAITALTGVSLGATGISYLTQSSPRQTIYIAGTNALACVIWSSAPYGMPKDELNRFTSDTASLASSKATASSALGQLNAAITQAEAVSKNWSDEEKAFLLGLKTFSSSAQTEISKTDQVQASAGALKGVINAAPLRIIGRTDAIKSEVDAQLRTLEPNPEAIKQIGNEFASGLRAAVQPASPPTETVPPKTPARGGLGMAVVDGSAEYAALVAAKANLEQALSNMRGFSASVSATVTANADAMDALAEIEACKPEGYQGRMTITPNNTSPTVAPGSQYKLKINGGSGVFNARAVGTQGNDVTITYDNAPFPSRNPIINFGPNAKGQQSIVFTDTNAPTANPITVDFTITSGTPNTETNSSTTTGGGVTRVITPPKTPARGALLGAQLCTEDLSSAQVKILQSALVGSGAASSKGRFIDGAWGKRTDQAAIDFLSRYTNVRGAVDPYCTFQNEMDLNPSFRATVFGFARNVKLDVMDCTVFNDVSGCWADDAN